MVYNGLHLELASSVIALGRELPHAHPPQGPVLTLDTIRLTTLPCLNKVGQFSQASPLQENLLDLLLGPATEGWCCPV